VVETLPTTCRCS